MGREGLKKFHFSPDSCLYSFICIFFPHQSQLQFKYPLKTINAHAAQYTIRICMLKFFFHVSFLRLRVTQKSFTIASLVVSFPYIKVS